ncbi:MAG: 50S ribosomal protein L3 [Candidatus Omnitrophica bacterium]|nr:50S ribosomal protein L3 [Candidatus Omnitrophota bacterium]
MGLLGKKIGMTQVYKESGKLAPVTVIEAGPCTVLQVKRKDSDGYEAVQLGFDDMRESLVNVPDMARFKKVACPPKRFVRELKLTGIDNYKVGQAVQVDIFGPGDFVDVTGTSVGRGFQGGVKRWGWHGGPESHGSMFHRAVGSIESGPRLTRVTKGHHLPGHMGCDTVTIANLEVIRVDKEKNLLIIKGSIPGPDNGYLIIRESKKLPKGSEVAKRRITPPQPPKKKKEGAWKKEAALKKAAAGKPAAAARK